MSVNHRVVAAITPVLEVMGYEVVGVEYLRQGKHSVLRVYIDQETGISVDDCEQASQQISALLDVDTLVPGQYALEVSSPGLDRPLFTLAHFARFLGCGCHIRLKSALDNRRDITGILKKIEAGNVLIDRDGEMVTIPYEMIEKANLVPDIQF